MRLPKNQHFHPAMNISRANYTEGSIEELGEDSVL